MSYSNYDEVLDAVRDYRDFEGNTMWGEWSNGVYRVYSYRTLIARYTPALGGERVLSMTKHSRTTSRHQGIIRRAWWEPGFVESDSESIRIW